MSSKREIDEVEDAVESASAPKVLKSESNGGKKKKAKDSDDENGVASDAEAEDEEDKSDTEKEDELPSVPVEIPEKEKGVSCLTTYTTISHS